MLFVACSSTGTREGCRRFTCAAMGRKTRVRSRWIAHGGSTLLTANAPGPAPKNLWHGRGLYSRAGQGQEFDDLVRVSDVSWRRRVVVAPVAREGLLVGGSAGGLLLEAVRADADEACRSDRPAGSSTIPASPLLGPPFLTRNGSSAELADLRGGRKPHWQDWPRDHEQDTDCHFRLRP